MDNDLEALSARPAAQREPYRLLVSVYDASFRTPAGTHSRRRRDVVNRNDLLEKAQKNMLAATNLRGIIVVAEQGRWRTARTAS